MSAAVKNYYVLDKPIEALNRQLYIGESKKGLHMLKAVCLVLILAPAYLVLGLVALAGRAARWRRFEVLRKPMDQLIYEAFERQKSDLDKFHSDRVEKCFYFSEMILRSKSGFSFSDGVNRGAVWEVEDRRGLYPILKGEIARMRARFEGRELESFFLRFVSVAKVRGKESFLGIGSYFAVQDVHNPCDGINHREVHVIEVGDQVLHLLEDVNQQVAPRDKGVNPEVVEGFREFFR
ncbi:MAG: hypothetical protein MRY21_04070 [Simkaniaceae bacterium]|nr:hypothetical protein [Simkaniaceae bacterium]